MYVCTRAFFHGLVSVAFIQASVRADMNKTEAQGYFERKDGGGIHRMNR